MEHSPEQIIKALECCNRGTTEDCAKCPRFDGDRTLSTEDCMEKLMRDALSLIKELTDENEKLKMFNKLHEQDVEDMHKMLEKKVEEVYPEFMRDYQLMRDELDGAYEELKESREDNQAKDETITNLLKTIEGVKGVKSEYETFIGELKPKIDTIRAEERADTVRKMHFEIQQRCIKGGIYPAFVGCTVDKVAYEMTGDEFYVSKFRMGDSNES